MNPVRTLGPAIAVSNFKGIWVYLTAPILGALCGAAVYSAVKLPDLHLQLPNTTTNSLNNNNNDKSLTIHSFTT